MWIQVRSMDGKTSHRIDGLSKLTKIEDLREKLEELHKIIYGKVDITRENYLQENDRRTRGSTRFYQERKSLVLGQCFINCPNSTRTALAKSLL